MSTEQIITNAADDPLFSTFTRRVAFFKLKGESDEEFAERLQIPCSRLRGWRYRKHEPSMGDVAHIADLLNVDLAWLATGRGHYTAVHPGVKVTRIPREPLVIYQLIGADGKPEGPPFKEAEMCNQGPSPTFAADLNTTLSKERNYHGRP